MSRGARAAIEQLQRAPQRYYQRPDATHLEVDPHADVASRLRGTVFLNRNSGVWRVNAAVWGVSPGFESNDLGFHSRGDAPARTACCCGGSRSRIVSRDLADGGSPKRGHGTSTATC